VAETAGKRKPKRGEEKAEKAEKPQLPSLEETSHWVGLRIDGIGNRTLGRVAGIHVDASDGDPRWTVIRLGPFAGCTAIPFEHVAEGAGRLWAAYEREQVREAPRFRPHEALSADNERTLCEHWRVRPTQGRAAELEGFEDEEVTAVPAEE